MQVRNHLYEVIDLEEGYDAVQLRLNGRLIHDNESLSEEFDNTIIELRLSHGLPSILENAPWRDDWVDRVGFGVFGLCESEKVDRTTLGISGASAQDKRKVKFPRKLVDLPGPDRLPSILSGSIRRPQHEGVFMTVLAFVWPMF